MFRTIGFGLATLFVSFTGLFAQGSPNVTLLAHLDDYGTYNDCWGYTAPDGREYALLGVSNGTSIVDITDAPANVHEVTFIPSQNSTWKDIKTYRHYAYTVNESGGGLQIIDLADLPNSATLIGAYSGFTTSHNIYIDTTEALLFAEGTTSLPVRIISLSDPENPVQLSTFGIECHDIFAKDGLAYIAEGYSGSIGIYNYNNPSSPQFVARMNIPSSGYVHNCWTTDDDDYLMSTEETTGKTVKLWNIQDLGNTDIEDTYLGPSGLAHNVIIKGDFAYISHYADGLRIVDISDRANIVEAGYYDTNSGTGGFVGAWGVFPFSGSDRVLISDISNGLFVFSFDDGSGSGIPCEDITSFVARCNGSGVVQSRVLLQNSTVHAGKTLTWTVDDVMYSETILTNGTHSIARLSVPGLGPGPHTVELTDPKSCFDPVQVNCSVSGANDAEWDEIEKMFDATGVRQTTAAETGLVGNYPNPFNPSTSVSYTVGEAGWVSLKVFNTLGQEVATLVDGFDQAGTRTAVWNGRTVSGSAAASGVYLVRLVAGSQVSTLRIMFMK